jgi:hypothetical protein
MFTAHQPEFLQEKGGKNIPFLDEDIPYLEVGGRTESLNQKIDPR